MRRPATELLIFARTPRLGQVKTRLEPTVTPEQALALHRAFVRDTIDLLGASSGANRITIAFSDEPDLELVPRGVGIVQQVGEDLGARLASAVAAAFDRGSEAVVVVGTDSPDLPPDRVSAAFAHLEKVDIVLGPAIDGGYYLIGLAGPHIEVFEGVDWGTERVLHQTRRRTEVLGLTRFELESWRDIDRPEDLQDMASEIDRRRASGRQFPRATARALEQFGRVAPN